MGDLAGGNGVLVVGGYGHVGRRIAALLTAPGAPPVRIAGRSGPRARALAQDLGCEAVVMDVAAPASWSAALYRIGTVVVCVDLETAEFPAEVLRRGLAYVDISATDAVLSRVEALQDLACAHGGMAVLSVGLAPGLTNLMAVSASFGLGEIRSVSIGVLLGLGDDHGAAAIDWTLERLRPLRRSDIVPLRFGDLRRPVPTIPFAFADQNVLRRRRGLCATTRLGLASPLMTASALWLVSRLAGRVWFRRVLRWSMGHVRLGSSRTALAVTAIGSVGARSVVRRLTLEGRAEADITALVAAEVIRGIPQRRRAGIWHIDECWGLDDFSVSLARHRVVIRAVLAEG